MKSNPDNIVPAPKCGDEPFKANDKRLGFILTNFWRWNVSDLLNNLTRGHLTEFIVAKALDAAKGVRNEWAAFDLETPDGIKVEVKSAAYLQSWHQDDYSIIQFSVRKTKELDWVNGGYRGIPKRHADVYVFGLLAHKKENVTKDKETVNPLDLNQWEFYVLPTKILNDRKRSQDSITLKSLQDLTQAVTFAKLADSVRQASKQNKRHRN
jgi:hypothetical protein